MVSLWVGLTSAEVFIVGFVFPRSAFADSLVALVPTAAEATPLFVLFALLLLWFATFLVVLLGVVATGEYANRTPRQMYGSLPNAGWLRRAKAAHDNLGEVLVHFVVAAYVSQQLQLDADLAAKWAALGLLARLMHPVVYIMNLDLLRTVSFAVAFFCCVFMSGAALFPEAFEAWSKQAY
eukprot:g2992.t1